MSLIIPLTGFIVQGFVVCKPLIVNVDIRSSDGLLGDTFYYIEAETNVPSKGKVYTRFYDEDGKIIDTVIQSLETSSDNCKGTAVCDVGGKVSSYEIFKSALSYNGFKLVYFWLIGYVSFLFCLEFAITSCQMKVLVYKNDCLLWNEM